MLLARFAAGIGHHAKIPRRCRCDRAECCLASGIRRLRADFFAASGSKTSGAKPCLNHSLFGRDTGPAAGLAWPLIHQAAQIVAMNRQRNRAAEIPGLKPLRGPHREAARARLIEPQKFRIERRSGIDRRSRRIALQGGRTNRASACRSIASSPRRKRSSSRSRFCSISMRIESTRGRRRAIRSRFQYAGLRRNRIETPGLRSAIMKGPRPGAGREARFAETIDT